MASLPQISGAELVRALEKIGFVKISQRGSHIKLRHPDGRTATVPNHKQLKAGTLKKGILNPLGMTVDGLVSLLRK